MKNNSYIFLIASIIFSNCGTNLARQEYAIQIDYEDNTGRAKCWTSQEHIKPDVLYLFFEEYFRSDSIFVTVNNKDEKFYLMSTNSAIGLAEVIALEGKSQIKQVGIRKGSGPWAKIGFENENKNKWAINFHKDTLRVTNLKYAPCYE